MTTRPVGRTPTGFFWGEFTAGSYSVTAKIGETALN